MRNIAWLLASLLLISPPASACTCDWPRSARSAFRQANAVFVGEVVSNQRIGEYGLRKVVLRVLRAWKGVEPGEIVTVTAGSNRAMCGHPFSESAKHLVYAMTRDKNLEYRGVPSRDSLTTSWCNRTMSLDMGRLYGDSAYKAVQDSVAKAEVDSLDALVKARTREPLPRPLPSPR